MEKFIIDNAEAVVSVVEYDHPRPALLIQKSGAIFPILVYKESVDEENAVVLYHYVIVYSNGAVEKYMHVAPAHYVEWSEDNKSPAESLFIKWLLPIVIGMGIGVAMEMLL